MNCYGIDVHVDHLPPLDPGFIPILQFNRAFLQTARQPLGIALERSNGQMASCQTFIHGTPEMAQADRYYVDRLVKAMLWVKGGYKLYVSGDQGICE